MNINLITPFRAINKAYLKEKISRNEMEVFKQQLTRLFNKATDQLSEDTLKDFITELLRNTWYNPNHLISINKERKDLSIHNGKLAKDPVAVIAEIKKMGSMEMMTAAKPNVKALHELVLYYLHERITMGNNEIKYLLATDVNNWVLIDANEFDKKIFKNTRIKKLYEVYVNDKKDNPFFYTEVKRILDETDDTITATHFNLTNFKKIITNADKTDDSKLINLFKILSPAHLLKLSFANDSNSLDKNFYAELLHLVGLEEVKDGSKKLIQRKKESNEASLLENAIIKLQDKDCLRDVTDVTRFGFTNEEQYYNIALELCITWINRILFLKLLEAQLYTYHQNEKEYLFLNDHFIHDFDELNNLFLQVLAEKPGNRRERLKNKFSKVPYLNSSLFERTELERRSIDISALDNNLPLPIHGSTVLKDDKGKRKQGQLPTLTYLFSFLDSYDFASEGKAEIQEENKTLINASVLGLIFEKINGYKDGSFFTPGFITMYMCRETLRRAVVQKFNEVNKWQCNDFEALQEAIDYTDKEKRNDANQVINQLTICDPAVGSGHFLVSALNELVSIKHDLKILQYRHNGQRIREYSIEIENDELILLDVETEDLFEYKLNQKGHIKPELQAMQETLFHEKETLIENCLFGVDINANSVKICRLRLWIELLKNAYYTRASDYAELETLPNIDINIKQGNSLISRFQLDADLGQTLEKGNRSIDSYKIAVQSYRSAQSKDEKRQMEELIDSIKKDFKTTVSWNDPLNKDLSKLRGKLALLKRSDLFSTDNKIKNNANKELEKLSNDIEKLEKEKEATQSNVIYKEAFEWRFEFPEVLDGDGKFLGFDAVIGNPPYMKVQDLNHQEIDWYKKNKTLAFKRIDISILFFELASNILKPGGDLCLITSNQFLVAEYGNNARKLLSKEIRINKLIDFGDLAVFSDALTYVSIFSCQLESPKNFYYKKVSSLEDAKKFYYEPWDTIDVSSLNEEKWILSKTQNKDLIVKLQKNNSLLNYAKCTYGIKSGADEVFIFDKKKLEEFGIENDCVIPLLRANNCGRYLHANFDQFTIYPYELKDGQTALISLDKIMSTYPNTYAYLIANKEKLEKRKDSRTTFESTANWYSLTRFGQLDIFERNEKIVFPGEQKHTKFGLDINKAGYSGSRVFGITISDDTIDSRLILGILNSRLIEFYIQLSFPLKQGGYYSMSSSYIDKIPICNQLPMDSLIIPLVDKILSAKKEDPKAETSAWEKEIDSMVYALYELTEEEIKLVEGNA